ncbi:hypothetical protein DB88DRAFT_390088 [Papiliotrema laurentii]|uniref:Peptidase S54 rhomboid domain-containing protein n=1 Tax=Papiliotrema laurentii TaxID=5418 RepID=A0AAD9FMQ1_PAPLA|nr:hypothetical protein DB88DRAFT_390088 [Papiliotrema laurentii]
MSFLGMRSLFASSSRSICRQTPLPLKSQRLTHHRWNSSAPEPTRHPIGRITPKRIAVRIPRSTGQESQGIPSASIWRPIVFCLALGGGGYVFAAWYTNKDTEYWSARLGAGKWWARGRGSQPSDREMVRAKVLDGAKHAQQSANSLAKNLSFLPNALSTPIVRLYVLAEEYVLNTPPAQLAPTLLLPYLGGVFIAWRLRRLEPFMRKWFLHRPVVFSAPRQKWQETVTLFTSTVSHQSFPHLAFNSIALCSFGAAAFSYLASPPPDTPRIASSTHTPHFYAFLLTAGLASSLASHLWTNLVRLPRLVRLLNNPARLSSPQALAAQQGVMPSLGASGAIYAALTLTACAFPDTSVGLIFIPFFSLPIGLGVAGMVTFDIIGLIRGWRAFDHVAHLGGAIFGVLYYQYGRQAWYWVRRKLQGLESESEAVSHPPRL